MSVRSKRLTGVVGLSGGGNDTVYTSPPGETTLIKEVGTFNLAAVPGGLVFYLNTIALDTVIGGLQMEPSAAKFHSGLFIVLQPGDVLRAAIFPSGGTVILFGAQLEGIAD